VVETGIGADSIRQTHYTDLPLFGALWSLDINPALGGVS